MDSNGHGIRLASGTSLPARQSFARHAKRLGHKLWDVEHYRFCGHNTDGTLAKSPAQTGERCDRPVHVAAVVLCDGQVFVGKAKTNLTEGDQYKRRLGFMISMGKALKRAIRQESEDMAFSFKLDIPFPTGVALRNACRDAVVKNRLV